MFLPASSSSICMRAMSRPSGWWIGELCSSKEARGSFGFLESIISNMYLLKVQYKLKERIELRYERNEKSNWMDSSGAYQCSCRTCVNQSWG